MVKDRGAVLKMLQQKENSDSFGVLVAGTPGSGKSTLIRNLFGVDFKGKQGEIKHLSIAVDGVSLTLYISYGIEKDSKRHLRQIQERVQNKLISLVIYCLPVNDTRLRREHFEILQRHTTAGVDWSRAVLALTFSDRTLIPKHERKHKDFCERSAFKQKRKEWMTNIRRQLVEDGTVPKGTEDAIRMCSTTEDREDPLPDGQEWYDQLWETIGNVVSSYH